MQQQNLSLAGETPGADALAERQAAYARRCALYAPLRDTYNRRADRVSTLSVILFLAAIVALLLGIWRTPFVALGILLFAGFLASFLTQGHLEHRRERYNALWQINDEGLKRLRRDWAGLPLPPASDDTPGAPFAADLDLEGRASLLQLLGTARTPGGRATLRGWLLHPAPPAVARQRQAAVAELAPEVEYRDELQAHGLALSATTQRGYETFLRWAEAPAWLTSHQVLIWASRVLPLLTLVLLVAQLAGAVAFPFWLITVALTVYLGETLGGRAKEIVEEVSEQESAFAEYAGLFGVLTSREFTAPALQGLQRRLTAGTVRADEQMRRLSRILALARLRKSIYLVPLQWATMFNVHVVWLLERWKREAGPSTRDWLTALGEIEALAALATLAYDNPTWTFPELLEHGEDGPARLVARDLGHPLLPPETCVGNDVTIGPPGTLLLVTGSNMSGKSTLLRAIGVNVVLAQAGGPVCAAELRLPPFALATSMRIADSLEYGVSYFLAELQRLKSVVDEARDVHAEGERTLLFLLDEILHGTNTGERQIAARQILRMLLALGATGAVSTHDLALADAVELASSSTLVHFTERFVRGPDGPSMTFDYRLRPGLATSTNALKLMEIVGLPISEDVPADAQA